MRYQDNVKVQDVLVWLKEQNSEISERCYHQFMLRALKLLPGFQARELGVDTDLLRAVRVRYKLPVDPKGARAVISTKRLPPHNTRARRRRIMPQPKPKVRPARQPKRASRADDMQLPLIVDVPPSVPKLVGTLDNPANSDWKIINNMARKKVFAIDRMMMLNFQGGVIHPRSKRRYTEADLEKEFGLTHNEALSCSMTFS